MAGRAQPIATAVAVIATSVGGASLILFAVFLFAGPLRVIRLELTEPAVLAWSAILSVVFFVQHSGMVRKRFRRWLSRVVPARFHDAVYAIVSAVVLTTVVVLWQPSAFVLYELSGYALWLSRGIFCLAIAGFGWGVLALRSFDPFGRAALASAGDDEPARPPHLTLRGPYVWVRHPLYFFVLLLFWATPVMAADRLLLNSLWTLWVIAGTVLEEKDLVAEFGDQYRVYQRDVPMLIPWRVPRSFG